MVDQINSLTLDNCDHEPIHVPGSIQPHGALLAFSPSGQLTHMSANASTLLGHDFVLGGFAMPGPGGSSPFPAWLVEALDPDKRAKTTWSTSKTIQGRVFDIVSHQHRDCLICELEPREHAEDISTFAEIAFRSLNDLKQSASVQELFDLSVRAVKDITGFDRVMAYRFSQDDSGSIIAEAREPHLDAYVGRRYPASDIPSQARRLYLLNTLRLIADILYKPVPVIAFQADSAPLDMTHSVLRSVSPIHVEYLTNMGVKGSMSASIVIGGRLWGMIACHHMQPMHVPYPVRMAVDVMAQVIAATVQSISARHREVAVAEATRVRTELTRGIALGESIVEVVRREKEDLRKALACDQLFLSLDGDAKIDEGVDREWAMAIGALLATRQENVVHVHDSALLPPLGDEVPAAKRYCGILAIRFDGPRQGWIVGLRRERISTIRWGGKPDKVIRHGPNGPRLTPRGSFEEWKEVVRGKSSPWNALQLDIAAQMMDAIGRAYSDRVVETDAMRAQLWAILGHDLRNPLQSINMANTGIERGMNPEKLNLIIRNSTGRMNRLLGDILDMSRLQHGYALTMSVEALDLAQLLRQLVEETCMAHPSCHIDSAIPPSIPMQGDGGRLAQMFGNLFSNARHHGDGNLVLAAHVDGSQAVVSVANVGNPIPAEIVPTLFDPFKRTSMNNLKNRTGMGLGLYIAAQVARLHEGTIQYVPSEDLVTFVITLPLHEEEPAHVD